MGTTTTAVGTDASSATAADESTTTGPTAECGNGDVEDGEECDATDWNGATCESLGYDLGMLACTESCVFDVAGCVPPGMVLVPGGTFEMGSSESENELPIRQVQVDDFWIDATEVTVADYAGCVRDGEVCSEPGSGASCNWMMGREDHPVNCVKWADADAYCTWAAKRLPTEAEWEKAARGTDARKYPWGDRPAPSCVQVVMDDGRGIGCGMLSTWPVGSKAMGDSPYGAHDMAGNAWEWVADWYADSYDAAATDNPTGPETGSLRVVHGGSWISASTNDFRAAYRLANDPLNGAVNVGFRCARTPPARP